MRKEIALNLLEYYIRNCFHIDREIGIFMTVFQTNR